MVSNEKPGRVLQVVILFMYTFSCECCMLDIQNAVRSTGLKMHSNSHTYMLVKAV